MLYPNFKELEALKNKKSLFLNPSHRSVKSIVPGNHHSPFRGQGLEFDSVREYVPGDDIRRIDWRVTARTGSPYLKIFKEERERHILICVDMNRSMRFGTKNTFKSVQAARAAAILGWQGLAQHDSVGACLFGDVANGIQYFDSQRSRKSFCQLLKILTEPCVEEHDTSINAALQHIDKASKTGSLIYVISDFLDIDNHFLHNANLNRLNKKSDVVFISINDRLEQSMYPLGTIEFCADESNAAFINTESISGRNAYAALWNENRKRLQQATLKFKIPMIKLTTESDIQNELILGLKSIGKRAQFK